jgi:hypothetical protein
MLRMSKETLKYSGKHKIVAIKKLWFSFFAFPVLSGKFGKQSLRVRAAKTFFFGITVFLYQNKNPEAHLGLGRQIYACLKYVIRDLEYVKRDLKYVKRSL